MGNYYLIRSVLVAVLAFATDVWAEDHYRLGFIGSLTSFAGNHGTAVLEGAKLAVNELEKNGATIDLLVEDDQSIAKNTAAAFAKLVYLDKVNGIVGGSWWISSVVEQTERLHIPLISCETLYDRDAVHAQNYFIMQGDLREWVRVFEPFVQSKGYQKGVIVRYVSGFGVTLEEEMRRIFLREGRTFLGALEYSDLQNPDVASMVLQLKRMAPDAVYIDAQSGVLANLLKRMLEIGLNKVAIFTHSAAAEILKHNLLDLSKFENLYFTQRTTFDKEFRSKFGKAYGKQPDLNADLGYYSVYLLIETLKSDRGVGALKPSIVVNGARFTFDAHNINTGLPLEVWKPDGQRLIKLNWHALQSRINF